MVMVYMKYPPRLWRNMTYKAHTRLIFEHGLVNLLANAVGTLQVGVTTGHGRGLQIPLSIYSGTTVFSHGYRALVAWRKLGVHDLLMLFRCPAIRDL